jgi:hypothetical protein
MNQSFEFEPSIDQVESAGACPVDPERAHKLSAEVLRSKLEDMTTPLVERTPVDPYERVRAWRNLKSAGPTGAEVFYFRNTHGN